MKKIACFIDGMIGKSQPFATGHPNAPYWQAWPATEAGETQTMQAQPVAFPTVLSAALSCQEVTFILKA